MAIDLPPWQEAVAAGALGILGRIVMAARGDPVWWGVKALLVTVPTGVMCGFAGFAIAEMLDMQRWAAMGLAGAVGAVGADALEQLARRAMERVGPPPPPPPPPS